MEKIKILHVLNSDRYSGAENVAIQLINNSPCNTYSIYASKMGSITNKLKENKIQFIGFKKLRLNMLNSICKREEIDVIYLHDFTASFIGALAFNKSIKKKISHIHQNPGWLPRLSIKRVLFLISCIFLDEIIFVSQQVREEAKLPKFISKKSTVISNMANVTEIKFKTRDSLISDTPQYDLVFVGRLENEKDPLKFLEIVKEISRNRKLRVIVVGSGSLMKKCLEYVNQEKLESVVNFIGESSNPFLHILNAKILINTSKFEGFGLSVLEAMTLSKPVIVSKVGGLRHIVDSNSGFLCDSKEEFVYSIHRLLNDSVLYEKLERGATLRAMELNNQRVLKERLKSMYKL